MKKAKKDENEAYCSPVHSSQDQQDLARFRRLASKMSAGQKRKVIRHLLEKADTP